jgi:hypothetical protein
MTQTIYYKVAGPDEPAGYRWSFDRARSAAGAILSYGGVDPGNPILAATGRTGNSSAIVAGAITLPFPGTRLVGMFGMARGTTIAPPPGFTERGEVTSPPGEYLVTLETADQAAPGSGSSGRQVATADRSGRNVGQLIALSPAFP